MTALRTARAKSSIAFLKNHPGRIHPFHRIGGKGGKAAALKDAMELVKTEVILIFDADYIPGTGLIMQLLPRSSILRWVA